MTLFDAALFLSGLLTGLVLVECLVAYDERKRR